MFKRFRQRGGESNEAHTSQQLEKSYRQTKIMCRVLAGIALTGFTIGVVGEIANGNQENRSLETQTKVDNILGLREDAWPAAVMGISVAGVGLPTLVMRLKAKEDYNDAIRELNNPSNPDPVVN
ncbi:MAG: hypothetical protein ACXWLH_00705 [Candidatus Saccharimonadales bacterium]